MSDDTKALSARVEALSDLLQHPGWTIYRGLVTEEIDRDFADHITRALDNPDERLATDRMRQIAAVRKAGQRWLKLPQEELTKLRAQVARDAEAETTMSRRGSL